jgi:hypothetical protein
VAVIEIVLMNSANPSSGTPLSRVSSSQVVQAYRESSRGSAGWVSVQGLKLEARDRLSEGSSASTAISEEEGESEEESEGGGWWRE